MSQIERKLGLRRNHKMRELEVFADAYAKRGIETQHGFDLMNQTKTFDRSFHLDGRWLEDAPGDIKQIEFGFTERFFSENPRYLAYFDLSHLKGLRQTQAS